MKWLLYDSNNSGGKWWLKDADWKALEQAGWTVLWAKEKIGVAADYNTFLDKDGRYMGALATKAAKQFESAKEGIAEWERVTGQDAGDEGCHCCGCPHNFEFGEADDPPVVGKWFSLKDYRYISASDFHIDARCDLED